MLLPYGDAAACGGSLNSKPQRLSGYPSHGRICKLTPFINAKRVGLGALGPGLWLALEVWSIINVQDGGNRIQVTTTLHKTVVFNFAKISHVCTDWMIFIVFGEGGKWKHWNTSAELLLLAWWQYMKTLWIAISLGESQMTMQVVWCLQNKGFFKKSINEMITTSRLIILLHLHVCTSTWSH